MGFLFFHCKYPCHAESTHAIPFWESQPLFQEKDFATKVTKFELSAVEHKNPQDLT